MAKKKTKKTNKRKKAVKAKKGKKAKRPIKAKKIKKAVKAKAEAKEKVLGKVDHFFDHISVAAVKILAPIKVGDIIHIKGHTTDFVEKIDSMQIEHQNVLKAKKGDDIGIKVKERVREHDMVYLASEKEAARLTAVPSPLVSSPSTSLGTSPAPRPQQTAKENPKPYSQTKFFNF